MLKFKTFFIYFITITCLILLFASFEAENFFNYSQNLNLSDKALYTAFTGDEKELQAYLNEEYRIHEKEEETRLDEYVLNDMAGFIKDYKLKLYYLGYAKYPESEILDEETIKNIRSYQKEKGIQVTESLNKETMDTLDKEPITYKVGHKGDVIYQAQLKLIEYKYLPADYKTTSEFTEDMADAVGNYQKNNGLNTTKTLNPETIEALNRDISFQTLNLPDSEKKEESPTHLN